MRKILLILATMALSSCTSLEPYNAANEISPFQTIKENWYVYTDSDFSINLPPQFKKKYKRADGSIGMATYKTGQWELKESDSLIQIYYEHPYQDCKNTTVLKPNFKKQENNSIILWGKVSGFSGSVDFKEPHCALETGFGSRVDGTERFTTSYALCSEKDEKAIFICIMQVTDNPALAEQIFSTFRWIK